MLVNSNSYLELFMIISHRNLRFSHFIRISSFIHQFMQSFILHSFTYDFMILYHVPKSNTLYAHICIIIKIYIDVCVCTRKLQQKRSKSSWKAPLPFRLMDLTAKRIPRTNSLFSLPFQQFITSLVWSVLCLWFQPACQPAHHQSVSESVSYLFHFNHSSSNLCIV